MRYPPALLALLLVGTICGVAVAQQTTDAEAFEALGFEPPLGLDSPKLAEAPAGPPVQGEELERRTQEVASLMRCPVCQGLSIADSPVDQALAMKGEVRKMIAAGYSSEQVLDYFERSYGEFIRLSPKPTGFNLFVWVVPILAILAGALLVVIRVRAARPPAPVSERATGDPELERYLERVRREVGG